MLSNKFFIINGKKIVLFILFYTIIMETFISMFHFPEWIRYFNDAALIMSICLMKFNFISDFKKNGDKLVLVGIGICFLSMIFSSILNYVSIPLIVWGVRNTFRGIVFFIASYRYLDCSDLDKIFKWMLRLQILNMILALYQSFILKHDVDFVGGIFGYGNGAGVNIFNAMLVSYYLNKYLNDTKYLKQFVFSLLSSLVIATFAEEKMTYIMCVCVVIISLVTTKFSYKKLIIVIIGVLCLNYGLNMLKIYNPHSYEILTNIDEFEEYSGKTYDEGYRIPRAGAFEFIENKFFVNDIENIFGLGFGNCETSSLSIFQSNFYKQYGEYNYRWFTHQWIFLETGYVGIVTFIGVFIIMLVLMFAKLRAAKDVQKSYIIASICTITACILTIFYNAMLKVDMSYIAYFSVSIGFIAMKKIEKL